MQTGYFNAAWQDIKNTPGWFGKLILLSLLSFVPIFGWLVVLGYLYGWARDIAWDVHGPMPKHIFGNEDGKLYSRGFFAMVIGFVFMLAPWVLEAVWGGVMGLGTAWSGGRHGGVFLFVGLSTMVFSLLIIGALPWGHLPGRGLVDHDLLPRHHGGRVLRDAVLVGGFHAHEHIRPPGRGVPVR